VLSTPPPIKKNRAEVNRAPKGRSVCNINLIFQQIGTNPLAAEWIRPLGARSTDRKINRKNSHNQVYPNFNRTAIEMIVKGMEQNKSEYPDDHRTDGKECGVDSFADF
jgi:hypothetical protein